MATSSERQRRVSITDVAQKAEVSITTVSRVINNVDYPVSQEARDRVLDAVQELNYTPNLSAQYLRKSFNNVIGLIVRDIANPYFGEIGKAVTEMAMGMGYLSFVCNTGRDPEEEVRIQELLWQHRVQGIILAGGGMSSPDHVKVLEKQIERSREHGFVIVSVAPQALPVRLVSVDYVHVAHMMTSYLAARGHRRIGFISGRADVLTCQHHVEGYKAAVNKAGLSFDEQYIVHEDFTETGGYRGLMDLLSRRLGITAICAGSDIIATGALQAAQHRNMSVPRDLSVIGVGDLPQARYTSPPLTTVVIPRYEMGRKAVELVLRGEVETSPDIMFQPQIIERSSVAELN